MITGSCRVVFEHGREERRGPRRRDVTHGPDNVALNQIEDVTRFEINTVLIR